VSRAVRRVERRLRRVRRWPIARRRRLDWWLVYGPVRSGTSYMMHLLGENARLRIGDWGLRHGLGLPPDFPHVRFDRERARADLSRNVLTNAPRGGGKAIDLVYKSAQLRPDEYDALVEMWGPPARRIFCVREPSGYLASAVRKFPDVDIQSFRDEYVDDMATYDVLGGDLFVYHPGLTQEDYRRFLAPLEVPDDPRHRFEYRGRTADELVTPEMVEAFERVTGAVRSEVEG
jgi:hypothetical protein